ncbi:MAG: right-handed parallel beta-helix repeat-containing protein [Candidatus Hodarchaeota archaeon]
MKVAYIILCISFCLAFDLSFHGQEGKIAPSSDIEKLAEPIIAVAAQRPLPPHLFQIWTVASNETRMNENITVDELTVERDASLTLMNCTLMINSNDGTTGEIAIQGELILRGGTIIKAVNPGYRYNFHFWTTSIFNGSDSTIRDVGNLIESPFPIVQSDRGIQLKSEKTILKNMTISHCLDGLAVFTNNPVQIDHCKIVDNIFAGVRVQPGFGNVVINNSLLEGNGIGFLADEEIQTKRGSNNTIQNCTINANTEYGIGILSGDNNTILRNHIANHSVGIYIEKSMDTKLERNVIEQCSIGIILEHGSSGNLLQQNNIRLGDIGISLASSGPNILLRNKISDTQEAALSIDRCIRGDSISSNNLRSSSGFAIRVTKSKLVYIDNNSILGVSEADPAVYIEESESCFITKNAISARLQAIHLQDSSNNIFSQNIPSALTKTFLLADGTSFNTTLTIFDRANRTSLLPGATLRLIPDADSASEVTSMTLLVDKRTFATSDASNYELEIDTVTLGGGNFTVTVEIMFKNGTTSSWVFLLEIKGRPRDPGTTSGTNGNMLLPLVLGMLLLGRLRSKDTQKKI